MAKPITFGNVIAGVNYTHPPDELPPYYLADAQNIVPVLNGYGSPRPGSARMNTTPWGDLITSFHELIVSDVSYKFAVKGTVIGKYNSTTGAFANHIEDLTDGFYGQWVNYGDYAIYANGSNKVKRTNGSTPADLTTDLSGILGGRCIAEWGERIWVGGYTNQIARLTGSALRAPTDFATTGATGFWQGYVGNKNQGITGVFPFFDILLIGKLNQIYMLTGAPETDTSTYRLIPLASKDMDSMGFTSKNAITMVGNDLLFLDGFNIKALTGIQAYGDLESATIVANIKDFFRDPDGAGLDADYLDKADFFHYKHKEQIHCSIPTGVNTRYWFIIDYSNREIRTALDLPRYSIYPMAGLTPICFGGVENGSKMDLYAGCQDGYVRKLDTGTDDDGTAVDSHMVWCMGSPERNIRPMDMRLSVKYETALTLALSYAMGAGGWEKIRDSSIYTALASENVLSTSWRRQHNIAYKLISSFMYNGGRSFAFKVRHNTAGETFEMRPSTLRFLLTQRYMG